MGSRQVELVVRRPGQPERRMVLGPGVTHLGRAEDNDLVLPDIGVSRRHARIVVEAGGVRFEDLGSGNGTFVAGKRVEQHDIEDGDEISVEPFTLSFHFHAGPGPSLEDDETLRAPQLDGLAGAPARLVTLAGHRLSPVYPVGSAPVAMGRSEARDIVLFDPAASLNHTRVELRGDGWWVRDLGSANGTFVNGERMAERRLSPGDIIRIGATEFRFEILGPAPEAPSGLAAPAPAAPPPLAPPEPLRAAPPPVQAAPPPAQAAPPAPQWTAPPAVPSTPTPLAPTHLPAAVPSYNDGVAAPAPPRSAAVPEAPAPAPAPRAGMGPVQALVAAVVGFVVVVGVLGAIFAGVYLARQRAAEAAAVAAEARMQAAADAPAPSFGKDVTAGIHEGKLLFAEGRYLESASRFYTVAQKEPTATEAKRLGFVTCEFIALDVLRDDLASRAASESARRDAAREADALARKAISGKGDLLAARDALDTALVYFPNDEALQQLSFRVRKMHTDALGADGLAALYDRLMPQYQAAQDATAAGDAAAARKAWEAIQAADSGRYTWLWYEAKRGLGSAGRP